jgi:hypothetical protein
MAIATHYTSLSVLLNHILPDNTFRMNSLSNVKDPFEYTKRTISAIDTRDYDQRFRDATATAREVLLNKIKAACFVADEGDEDNFGSWKSILNPPLWAHYGDNNSGVAIVFNVELFLEACRKKTNYSWALSAAKMSYLESASHLDKPNIIRLYDLQNTEYITVAKYVFERAADFWHNKNDLWAHENEYRVMLVNEEIGSTMIDIKESIKAIAFGEKVSDVVLTSVGEYCHRQGITILKVDYDEIEERYMAINAFP